MKVKGMVLAGGRGTRLNPITLAVNKHLLPVHDKPMIYYPLMTLIKSGVEEIMVVSSEDSIESISKVVKELALPAQIDFGVQAGFGGIAEALNVGKDFCKDSKLAAILGDNFYQDDFATEFKNFSQENYGAHIFLKECDEAHRFGVATMDSKFNVLEIEEKPQGRDRGMAVTGLYLYDQQVFDVIAQSRPSARGEMEITDVNNWYLNQHQLKAEIVKGEWVDAGTFDSLYNASRIARKLA